MSSGSDRRVSSPRTCVGAARRRFSRRGVGVGVGRYFTQICVTRKRGVSREQGRRSIRGFSTPFRCPVPVRFRVRLRTNARATPLSNTDFLVLLYIAHNCMLSMRVCRLSSRAFDTCSNTAATSTSAKVLQRLLSIDNYSLISGFRLRFSKFRKGPENTHRAALHGAYDGGFARQCLGAAHLQAWRRL